MSDDSTTWKKTFADLFSPAVEKYRQGHHQAANLLDVQGATFLVSIGYTEQEFFDFVEDFARGGEPSLETALAIATVRRDYFLQVQKGAASTRRVGTADLPAKDKEVKGIAWLPRLIAKAEAKLRGEMAPDLMYCCGGDRRFFKDYGIDAADFLRKTWEAAGDHQKIISWVKSHSVA